MAELEFVVPQKIGSELGFLKNIIQFDKMQTKEEGSNGFSGVIWAISGIDLLVLSTPIAFPSSMTKKIML